MHLTPWKEIADAVGMHGIDVAGAVFDGLCKIAFGDASIWSRVTTDVCASWWGSEFDASHIVSTVERYFPCQVGWSEMSFALAVSVTVIERQPGESGRELYARARSALEATTAFGDDQPARFTLTKSWEEASDGE